MPKPRSLRHDMIIAATGCPETDAAEVEEIMRHTIFHSTLDWQTRAELELGAKQAYTVLKQLRSEEKQSPSSA